MISVILFSFVAQSATISGKVIIKSKSGEIIKDTCEDTVVFVGGAKGGEAPGSAKIAMKDRDFTPSVLPVMKGTKVSFPNEDKVLHNAFSLSKTKKFDLGLYRKSEGKDVTFDKTGLVKVYCNIHPGMVSNVLVLDNPYFSKVSKDCSFKIKNVPAGSYKLNSWYRFGKGVSRDIKVGSTNLSALTVELKETKKRKTPHKNKHGKSYKKAY